MKTTGNSNFEEFLKDSLESYEPAYDPQHWEEMQSSLDSASRISRIKKVSIATVIGAAAITGGFLLFGPDDTVETVPQEQITEHVSEQPTSPVKHTPVMSNEEESPAEQPEVQPEEQPAVQENQPEEQPAANNEQPEEQPAVQPEVQPEEQPAEEQPETAEHKPLKPTASFSASVTGGCKYTTVQFKVNERMNNNSYMWEFGDGGTSDKANPRHVYKEAGNYGVKLTVTNRANGEIATLTKPQLITISPAPEANFTWSRAVNAQQYDPTISFTNNSFNAVETEWIFGDGHDSKEGSPKHLFNKKGSYPVMLIAKNSMGCADTAMQSVMVDEDYNLLAPTGFSPNGDGNNDTWIPVALKYMDSEFTLNVIDVSSGKVVYTTNDKNQPWDGRNRSNNQMVRSGASFGWVAVVKDSTGSTHEYGGAITIH